MSASAELLTLAAGIRLLVLDVDGVLTDGRLYYDSRGEEMKAFHTRDGLGIKMLMSSGVAVAIITARQSSIVARRAAELGIAHCVQGSKDKLASLLQLQQAQQLRASQLAFMGDDLPDLAAMMHVGLPLTVAEAPEPVAAVARWCSLRPGGYGAVREACELILRARGALDSAVARFHAPAEAD